MTPYETCAKWLAEGTELVERELAELPRDYSIGKAGQIWVVKEVSSYLLHVTIGHDRSTYGTPCENLVAEFDPVELRASFPLCVLCRRPNRDAASDTCPVCTKAKKYGAWLGQLELALERQIAAASGQKVLREQLTATADIIRAAQDFAQNGQASPKGFSKVAKEVRAVISAAAEIAGCGPWLSRYRSGVSQIILCNRSAAATLRSAKREPLPAPPRAAPAKVQLACDHGWDESNIGWAG